jgi:hypothetical protein
MVDGAGAPGGTAYTEAVGALYPLAYGLRAAVKKAGGAVHSVSPLEGLWWADDPAQLATVEAIRRGEGSWSDEERERWRWTLMIMQPTTVTDELAAWVLPAGTPVRFDAWAEGLAAQILHIGPYSAEPATMARLHAFIGEQGYKPAGLHHEIYLGDPRRAAPEKLRTILRQPVAPL